MTPRAALEVALGSIYVFEPRRAPGPGQAIARMPKAVREALVDLRAEDVQDVRDETVASWAASVDDLARR